MTTRPDPARPGRVASAARSAEMLWAAAQLFARQGVAATTTRQIAEAAQTTERTLFKHFGSKEALVAAVLDEAVLAHLTPASLDGLSRAIAAFGGDLQVWHRALLLERLNALAAAPELSRLLLAEMARDAAVLDRFAALWRPAVWDPLVGLFGQLQQEGRIRRDAAPKAVARQFLSLNLGFLLTRLLLAPGPDWQDAEEVAAIARTFASGLAPDGARETPRRRG